MSAESRKYRVVVVGVARDRNLSPQDLSQALSERMVLPPDVRLAVESGRSAVVQTAESEQQARRAATLLIKLGAEIRIEPDESPGPGALGDVDLGEIQLSYLDDTTPSLDLNELKGEPTQVTAPPAPPPAHELPPLELDLSEREDPTQVEVPPDPTPRPSSAAEPAPLVNVRPPPERFPVSHTPAPRPSSALELRDPPAPATTESPAEEAGQPDGASGSNLVRCPVHGLLYDADRSSGCRRCLGIQVEEEPRGLTRLRTRPRLWIALGVFLSLGLSSIPAVLYAGNQKRGPLLQQRIEAEAIRRGRIRSTQPRRDYAKALKKVAATKSAGLAVTAVIWLVGAALLMFLWFRFV
jgi:hypothetical protein